MNQIIIEQLGGVKPNVLIKNKLGRERLGRLEELKSLYENEIPTSFINFINEVGAVSFNSGIQINALEDIPISYNNNVSVDNFYDLANDDASIMNVLDRFSGNLPKNLLPICDGEPGDLIVIQMDGKDYKKVYYWYHDNSTLYFLANDFEKFLNKLSVNEELESESDSSDVTTVNVSNKFLERLKRSGKLK
jgi:hypothetical protein